MTRSPERQASPKPSANTANSVVGSQKSTKADLPPSPTRSDKSSESEGKPVREKLKETRIDAQATSESAPAADQTMKDVPNGKSSQSGDQSASGSESERGRLRRKRSREDFEEDHESEQHQEKKHERHTRKKSRDVSSPEDPEADSTKPGKTSVTRIDENDADESMVSFTSERQTTPENGVLDTGVSSIASPKNKRTRDQVEGDANASISTVGDLPKSNNSASKTEEERDAKRPKDEDEAQSSNDIAKSTTKIPSGSAFANNSAESPFAALSKKPQIAKASDPPAKDLPQTSDDKFKASGFGTFSNSTASPFGNLGKSGTSSSPFASTGGDKLSSFASKPSTSTPSGIAFAGLGSSGKPGFGGSAFGGTLGSSGFGNLTGTKTSLASFATPGSQGEITGLKAKSEKAFGAPTEDVSDEEDGSGEEDDSQEDESKKDKEQPGHERRTSQHLLSQQAPLDTGEEGEEAHWSGRAKLYALVGESSNRGWQERGTGPLKLNITAQEEPKKARFVCRADGTHRLLLNAAVTKQMKFGDANGEKPKDGRILFNAPNPNGELETYLLRMKVERAAELWDEVKKIQQEEL